MAHHERLRELLGPSVRATAADQAALAAAAGRDRARQAERLEQAGNRMRADVRSRPEDSSPAIRRLLGYADAARPAQRWDNQTGWRQDGSIGLVSVHVGPVDPPAVAPRRARV